MKRPTHMRRFLKPALKRNRLFYSVLLKFKEQLAQQTAYSDSIRGKGGILRPSSDGGLIHLNHAMSHFETIKNGVRVFLTRPLSSALSMRRQTIGLSKYARLYTFRCLISRTKNIFESSSWLSRLGRMRNLRQTV